MQLANTETIKTEQLQKMKLYLYALSAACIIISRIMNLIDWNLGMSITSVLVAITLLIDAYNFKNRKQYVHAFLNGALAIVIVVMIVILWIIL